MLRYFTYLGSWSTYARQLVHRVLLVLQVYPDVPDWTPIQGSAEG